MKKHLSLLSGVVLSLGLLTTPAHADNLYISGNVGWALSNDLNIKDSNGSTTAKQSLKTGINIEGALGSRFDNFRLEGEVAYNPRDIDGVAKSNVHIASFLANGYYDFTTEGIQPYLSAGIGLGWQTNDIIVAGKTYSGRLVKLAYQLGAGVAVPISKSVLIDARYRYFGMPSITEGNALTYTPTSNSFLLGLRVGI